MLKTHLTFTNQLRWPILAVTYLVYALFGTYPFDWRSPFPPNAVLLRPDGTLSFPALGIAKASSVRAWLPNAEASGRLSIDVCARTLDVSQTGPARVITFSRDPYALNYTLGQQAHDLIVRLRTDEGNGFGGIERSIAGVFGAAGWHVIHMQIEPGLLSVSVDGQARLREILHGNPIVRFDPDFGLALGNELSGNRPWRGEVRCAVLRTPMRTVDLLAPGALSIPWRVNRPNQPPQLVPFIRLETGDVVINLLGFVPLGFLTGVLFRPRFWREYVAAWTPMAAMSLAIEITQFTLPNRFPSVSDLILNCAGAALGMAIARRL
jgi:VanZ family protein